MMTLWFALSLSVVCLAKDVDKTLDVVWEAFKQTHSKQYSEIEEGYRRYVWEQNVALVQKHNLEYDLGKYTYTLGINEYSDWTPKEYARYLNGFRAGNRTAGTAWRPQDVTAAHLPTVVDWREKGYVTPIKNQGQCGSCWAFSSTGALEGQHFRATGKLVSLSEQNLVDCSQRFGNAGCNGGWMASAFTYVYYNEGLDLDSCYPYHAKGATCQYNSSCVGTHCSGYIAIAYGDEEMLQYAVATQGPVAVAIDATHESFFHYRSGVYSEPNCSSSQTDHAVLVVGYGSDGGHDYWLVKNSWGTSWGMKGYIKMARHQNNMCAIASYAVFPTVPKTTKRKPQLGAKSKLKNYVLKV